MDKKYLMIAGLGVASFFVYKKLKEKGIFDKSNAISTPLTNGADGMYQNDLLNQSDLMLQQATKEAAEYLNQSSWLNA